VSTVKKSGAALVVVMGLLTVLTIMAVAFAIAMRVERLAARNYANGLKTEHLIQVALVRAMEAVGTNTQGFGYPDFSRDNFSGYADVSNTTCSRSGTENCIDMLNGEATNFMVLYSLNDAFTVAPDCTWIYVTNTLGDVKGRIAWLVADCGGLLDANEVGSLDHPSYTNVVRTSPADINIGELPDFITDPYGAGENNFLYARENAHIRYESLKELIALNSTNMYSVSNLFIYSYDPDPDKICIGFMGAIDTPIADKFNLNAITNCESYVNSGTDIMVYQSDTNFSQYYEEMETYLLLGNYSRGWGYGPHFVPWRIVNWLDADKIPHHDVTSEYAKNPFCRSSGLSNWWGAIANDRFHGEPCPTINEIAVHATDRGAAPSNKYEVIVELWYPFTGSEAVVSDGYWLDTWVWPYSPNQSALPAPYVPTRYDQWSFSNAVPIEMKYGTITEYQCFVSPDDKVITFFDEGTGQYMEIGTNALAPAGGSNVWIKSIVWMNDIPVDCSPGWMNECDTNQPVLRFDQEGSKATYDPFLNHDIRHWSPMPNLPPDGWMDTAGTSGWTVKPYASAPPTLGYLNVEHETAFDRDRNGYPQYIPNRPMRSAGELSWILADIDSDYDAETSFCGLSTGQEGYNQEYCYETNWIKFYWKNINLMCWDSGSMLLDYFTVHETTNAAPARRGLISLSSPCRDVIFHALRGIREDPEVTGLPASVVTDDTALWDVAGAIVDGRTYNYWDDLFGPYYSNDVANAMRNAYSGVASSNAAFSQSVIRNLTELVSFRQNIFTIVLAAQALEDDGVHVAGERRAVAVVCRDSYTGRYFVRQFKWLEE